MNPPFSAEQFLAVFEAYNRAVYPFQIVLLGAGLVAVLLARRSGAGTGRAVTAVLALLWVWMGAVYHLGFFRAVNPLATLFGWAFIGQGLLFALAGWRRSPLTYRWRADGYGSVGGALLLYALVIYPLLGYALGHGYPRSPTLGLPCPTVIFTFGLLLLTTSPLPSWLLAIPFLCGLVGFSAVWVFGILEDVGLLVAALLGAGLLLYRERTRPAGAAATGTSG